MSELPLWMKVLAFLLLVPLGWVLYFSGSALFNVWAVPMMQGLSPEQAHQGIVPVLVGISFLAASIGAFFSVFLYELIGGGRPLLAATLFALPLVGAQLYALWGKRLTTDMVAVYLIEMVMIWFAYLLLSYLGRAVRRRFFSSREAAVS